MNEQQAWYKQFWPWFLIILPLCAVVASFTTLKIALSNSDSLVAEDYYKEGKAINMDLSKVQYAKQLGMQFSLEQNHHEVLLTQHGGPAYQAALKVEFYHPTLAEKDLKLTVTADANHVYRITLPDVLTGPWEVRLEGFDGKWRIHQRVELKDNAQLWLN
ncbi:FixH family protein [Shewanella sp. CG12_big_fil_rev_8_21_14_0_65_47_15]|uniref:FixH family protein n=1 Tax=Shewanella sp. CG12_big_fil_rev_8_21_14_0_65_47_15 TaxID=1975537 RepID=UPI000CAA24C4|nr:FixH family protein [Shewanella sp. CG12_big_fil_rev_8_21_14_0_65_47_15]PIW60644.1 MAG: cytochrome C oxidase Cbb3 [Shewanella sp. CG12_big_fil_rev_8_21_14_0_65_47_15]